VALNLLFVAVEAAYGWLGGSLALLADAGHNLSDVFGLLLAWGAAAMAARPPSERRTYGLRKSTVLASLFSALLLLGALAGIAWEAVRRFAHPQPVAGREVILVAAVGVVINTATALLFLSGRKEDLNVRGAFLHMAADAALSLGVVVAGAVMMATGWLWVDPVVSLIIVAVVLVGTWPLLRDSLDLALDAAPRGVDMAALRRYLEGVEGVARLHDLHVWPLSTTEVALSVHLVMAGDVGRDFLPSLQRRLREHFGIAHATIQLERVGDEPCLLDEDRARGTRRSG
jgi:cobalt-zinc-cadmium efflux system protein